MRVVCVFAMTLAMVATSCSAGDTSDQNPGGDTAAVMAAAIRTLMMEQDTIGPSRGFSALLLQDSTDPDAGVDVTGAPPSRQLTDDERAAIETAIAGLADDVRWIDDRESWVTDDMAPSIPNSAIIGVGEPIFDDDGALVPISLWCGALCGVWFSWRLALNDGSWEVTGVEGPVAQA